MSVMYHNLWCKYKWKYCILIINIQILSLNWLITDIKKHVFKYELHKNTQQTITNINSWNFYGWKNMHKNIKTFKLKYFYQERRQIFFSWHTQTFSVQFIFNKT